MARFRPVLKTLSRAFYIFFRRQTAANGGKRRQTAVSFSRPKISKNVCYKLARRKSPVTTAIA